MRSFFWSDLKVRRVTPRHILLAVRSDEELDKYLSDVIIRGGGVIPHIHQSLVNGKFSANTTTSAFGGPGSTGFNTSTFGSGFGANTTAPATGFNTSTFGGVTTFGAPQATFGGGFTFGSSTQSGFSFGGNTNPVPNFGALKIKADDEEVDEDSGDEE